MCPIEKHGPDVKISLTHRLSHAHAKKLQHLIPLCLYSVSLPEAGYVYCHFLDQWHSFLFSRLVWGVSSVFSFLTVSVWMCVFVSFFYVLYAYICIHKCVYAFVCLSIDIFVCLLYILCVRACAKVSVCMCVYICVMFLCVWLCVILQQYNLGLTVPINISIKAELSRIVEQLSSSGVQPLILSPICLSQYFPPPPMLSQFLASCSSCLLHSLSFLFHFIFVSLTFR